LMARQTVMQERPKQDIGSHSRYWSRLVTVDKVGPHEPEIPSVFSLCELAKSGEIEFYDLPTLKDERQKALDRFALFHGERRLDHEVVYKAIPFICPRLQRISSHITPRTMADLEEIGCFIDIGRYAILLSHAKKQALDSWHYVYADQFGIDIFLTLDKKFIKPFRQVEEKIRARGCTTLVLTPQECCKKLRLVPIPPPKADPRSILSGNPFL
ncbi:hypothetical protein LCGC14_3075310, partial [marine sediment metagenome]